MRHLLLLSNHLNNTYCEHARADKVSVVLAKEQFTAFKYHQHRIVYHLAASKHFAQEESVDFLYNDTFASAFKNLPREDEYIIYTPNDFWMRAMLKESIKSLKLTVTWLDDLNFFFTDITTRLGNSPYKLDPLYKAWRQELNILMENKKPVGGAYSFDQDNRNPPPKTLNVTPPLFFEASTLTKEVIDDVKRAFKDHPKSQYTFNYPVTRKDALALLEHFLSHRLKDYGVHQDAMMKGEAFMAHSLLSTAINLGLLLARDVVAKAENAYQQNKAPLAAVEGFIRQILGWREYIRGIYLKEMPTHYQDSNHLNHTHALPSALYTKDTPLHCLSVVVNETFDFAYNHHIERLMIIGNLTNLMFTNPAHVRRWFNEMYIDSFDWVVTPNVIGMAEYADQGLMSTKPYIASANYINKMSNYCKDCIYNPKEKTGENACPVNALYYNYLDTHYTLLSSNPRMKYMLYNYKKLDPSTLEDLKTLATLTIKNHTTS